MNHLGKFRFSPFAIFSPLYFGIAVALSLIATSCMTPDRHDQRASEEAEIVEKAPAINDRYGFNADDFLIDTLRIPSNSTLGGLFREHGVSVAHINQIDAALDTVFPPRRIRAGNLSMLFYQHDSVPAYWVYHHTQTQYLRMDFLGDTLRASLGELPVTTRQHSIHAIISSSLWNAMREAGARPELALSLSDIFAWTVDFFGLSVGDEFVATYDEQLLDDEVIDHGVIYAARYISGGDTINAYRYMQDSVYSYWDDKGNSLRKAFLKAPLRFSRISSGFSYARRHPILKIVRPHTGVDYAAPAGTPVMALGGGKVIAKGFQRGGGNFVKIRHNSVYTTAYLHLSRFGKGIAPGVRVAQGQVIGYVGSTGMATGPHLDFRVWKNGKPVNPLHVESPPVEPIDSCSMEQFLREAHRLDSLLNQARVPAAIRDETAVDVAEEDAAPIEK